MNFLLHHFFKIKIKLHLLFLVVFMQQEYNFPAEEKSLQNVNVFDSRNLHVNTHLVLMRDDHLLKFSHQRFSKDELLG